MSPFFVISFSVRTLLLFLCFCFPLLAQDEIVVHLATEEKGLPLYLAPFQKEGSGFEKSYITALEQVLHFDFAHDGQTEVVSSTKCPRKLEVKISQKTASVKLTLPNASKGIEEVPLTGELAKDRFALHQIHDTLFQALYDLAPSD